MKTQTDKPITTDQISKIKDLISQVHAKGMSGAEIEFFMSKINKKLVRNIEDLTHDTASQIIARLTAKISAMPMVPEKPKVGNPVTTAQIKKIHVLLSQRGLLDEKKAIIRELTDGRTESTRELYVEEAGRLINYLSTEENELSEKKKTIYKAIWWLAWNMGIIYGKTDADFEMNKAKLNMFCRDRGSVKKNLADMDLMELQKIQRQFEAMYTKYKRNKKDKK